MFHHHRPHECILHRAMQLQWAQRTRPSCSIIIQHFRGVSLNRWEWNTCKHTIMCICSFTTIFPYPSSCNEFAISLTGDNFFHPSTHKLIVCLQSLSCYELFSSYKTSFKNQIRQQVTGVYRRAIIASLEISKCTSTKGINSTNYCDLI